jgi:hypothetical protein
VAELSEQARQRWGRGAVWGVMAATGLGLLALGLGSGNVYLSRPVADRYEAYGYDLFAMANAAGSEDVVILDAYSAGVIRFLDAGDLPQIAEPGTPLPQLAPTASVLARSLTDLETAVGAEAVERAEVVAVDPNGDPVVWRLRP